MKITKEQLAGMIDHSLLKPQSTREELKKLCAEAIAYGFKTVCVNPIHVADAAALLEAKRARNSRHFVLELMANLRPGSAIKTPASLLDRAAVTSLSGCTFKPGRDANGQAVGAATTVEYVWKLE